MRWCLRYGNFIRFLVPMSTGRRHQIAIIFMRRDSLMATNTENRRTQHIQRGYCSRSTAIFSHTVASAWQPRQSAPKFIRFERLLLLATLQHMLRFASAHRIELDG